MQCTYKRNTKVRLSNQFCRGRAISVTYCECLCVALVIQHAMRIRHIFISAASRVTPYFPTLSHKRHDLGGGALLNIKLALIFSTTFAETLLILGINNLDMIISVYRYSRKVPTVLVRFSWNLNSVDRFSKNSQYRKFLSLYRAFWYSHSSFTNRCTFIKTLIKIYINGSYMFRSTTIIKELEIEPCYAVVLQQAATPPQNKLQRNLTECFYTNITLARLNCKLPDDGRRPKHVGAILFNVNCNQSFNKCASVGEWTVCLNAEFHENSFSGSRVVPCERTDKTDIAKLIAAFRNSMSVPRKSSLPHSYSTQQTTELDRIKVSL